MTATERANLLSQILWDYNLPANEVDEVLRGEKEFSGHYNRETIFLKILESYPWFTIIQLIPPSQIKQLLTGSTIHKLRSAALRQKYEFVQKRLQQIIPATR